MKRIKKYLKWAVLIVFLLITLGELGDWIFYTDPEILQVVESPNGKYVAYVYESNGGVTTSFCYHISVKPKWLPLGKGSGNTWMFISPPHGVEWIDDRTLLVDIYRSKPYIKETRVWGVDIIYTN